MLKLGPGWLCQPKSPPGPTRLSVTMTVESPFVRKSIFQSPVLMLRFVAGRTPEPIAVLVTPLAGVARVTPVKAAAPRTATSSARLSRSDIGKFSFEGWSSRASAEELLALWPTYGDGRRAPTVPAGICGGCWHPPASVRIGTGLVRLAGSELHDQLRERLDVDGLGDGPCEA